MNIIKRDINQPRINELNETQCNAVNESIMEEIGLKSKDDSVIILAIFAQQGVTSNNVDRNITVIIEGKTYKLSQLRMALRKAKCTKDLRRYA